MSSMKAAWDHGCVMPCACRRAIVSVAASSTTRYPASSNARTIEVFPHPGVPVSMYRFIVSSNSGSFVGPISAQARRHGEPSRQRTQDIRTKVWVSALRRARSEIARKIKQRIAGGSGNFVGRLCGIVGLDFVGLGQRRRRVVGLVHRAFEIANRLAHRAADIAELAGPEDDQDDQQNDQQMSWRKEVHIFLRAGRGLPSHLKVYILDYRIATSIPGAQADRAGS